MTVKDVELRFVTRSTPAPELGANISKRARYLQMRKLVTRQWSETWFHDGRAIPKSGIEDQWTEWLDVPFEEDA